MFDFEQPTSPTSLVSILPRNQDLLDCQICMSIFHNAMSIIPCLHTFCAGCICKWFAENQNCPNCRAPGTELIPNRHLRSYVSHYLEINNDENRNPDDFVILDEFELEYWENWLIQFNPKFLSSMQLSLSGDLRLSKISSSHEYHESRYNEVKRRVQTLREERHLRNSANGRPNPIQYLEPIDMFLKRMKNNNSANNKQRAIMQSMSSIRNTMGKLDHELQREMMNRNINWIRGRQMRVRFPAISVRNFEEFSNVPRQSRGAPVQSATISRRGPRLSTPPLARRGQTQTPIRPLLSNNTMRSNQASAVTPRSFNNRASTVRGRATRRVLRSTDVPRGVSDESGLRRSARVAAMAQR